MFSIHDQRSRANHLDRREWLRVGGLSAVGLTLPQLLQSTQTAAAPTGTAPRLSGELGSTFGKARNVIFLWLQGGPPQHETFDPKPAAPAEIRGPFKPISKNFSKKNSSFPVRKYRLSSWMLGLWMAS